MIRLLAAAFLLAAVPARAQPTNADVVAQLAADCLADVPPARFTLDGEGLPVYLRQALVRRWQQAGRRVFVAGGADALADATGLPRLTFEAPAARVVYGRKGRRRLTRQVALRLPYTLVGAGGEILSSGTCDTRADDAVARAALPGLENADFPETVGRRPAPGWVARYAEPALLGGAVAVSTLLFFSLRSR